MRVSKFIVLSFAVFVSTGALALAADDTIPSVTPDVALTKLKEGNARFSSNNVSEGKPNAAKRAETQKSQHPFAIVLACADSRTSPEIVFDANLGDLFVVRTAGNVVDEHALGSIEYAVEHLGARLIVVMGHERCGAVIAAVASDTAPSHIQSLVRDIQPAVKIAKDEPGDSIANTTTENARLSAAKITREADLGELAKDVQIVSAVYNLDTGKVDWGKGK
ncbi:MAG: carbonic anhydrase [Chthoniobacterales bacterium]